MANPHRFKLRVFISISPFNNPKSTHQFPESGNE